MAVPVPMTLQSAADLIDLSIQRISKKMTNLPTGAIERLYHEEKTEDYYDKDSSLSGFREASRMTENVIIASDSPIQGFDKTYTQVFHGHMAQFTLYDWKFGIKKRKLESVTGDSLKACQRKKERLLTEYLENSKEGTTSYSVSDDSGNWTKTLTGGDGDALISATHAREDGGADVVNEITDGTTVNMDFDTLGLKGMLYTASLMKDPRGNLMDVNPTLLVFRKGSSAFFKAMEINGALKSGKKSESADRDGAAFGAFETLELPYLTTTASAYWWGFDTSMMSYETGLQVRTSQSPVMDSPETDYKTKTIYVSSTFAMDYGHNDYRNVLGSDGTNA